MQILNVIRSVDLATGGPAEGLRQLVQADRRAGHVHEVLTLDAPGETDIAFPAPLHALGPCRGNYGHTPRLRPWLRAHASRFDAVIVHGLWQYHGLATRRALRGGDVPYFVFPHGMLDPWFARAHPLKHAKKWLYWPWAEYRVLRDAAAVLFTCDEEARLAPQSFWLYRARPAVVGFGVALDAAALRSTSSAFMAAHPAARGKRLLLFLGRVHPKKGCDLLIDAFAKVAARDPDLRLVMVGPDQVGWRVTLENQARHLGLSDRIIWCGMLQGELKWSAFRAAEAFVLPSHQENFGIAVAEALALGVPVLISDQVNIWREIDAAGAGLVAADDAAGTASLLERWLALSRAEREAMAQRATLCFDATFRVDAAARRLAEVIERHLATRRSGARASAVPRHFTAMK